MGVSRRASARQGAAVATLHENRDRLEAAYVFEQRIDAGTYRRRKEKLDQEIIAAEMAERESRLEELDVEGVLGFAETLLTHPAKLWTEFSIDQKLRFQKILFPSGLTYRNGVLGTAETSPLFRLLRAARGERSGAG